jgi:transcriptional regulator with XRE-family HTH domain
MINVKHERLLYEALGKRVRELRQDRFTQAELAALLDMSRTSVTNLERGRQRIPLHQLLRIADALGCELGELLPTREALGLSTGGREQPVEVVGKVTPSVQSLISRYT